MQARHAGDPYAAQPSFQIRLRLLRIAQAMIRPLPQMRRPWALALPRAGGGWSMARVMWG